MIGQTMSVDTNRPVGRRTRNVVELRLALVEALGGRCARCGGTERLEVDHKVPVALGGKSDISNLQALCARCHREKTTAEMSPYIGQKISAGAKRRKERKMAEEAEREEAKKRARLEAEEMRARRPSGRRAVAAACLRLAIPIHDVLRWMEFPTKENYDLALEVGDHRIIEAVERRVQGRHKCYLSGDWTSVPNCTLWFELNDLGAWSPYPPLNPHCRIHLEVAGTGRDPSGTPQTFIDVEWARQSNLRACDNCGSVFVPIRGGTRYCMDASCRKSRRTKADDSLKDILDVGKVRKKSVKEPTDADDKEEAHP